MASLSVQPFLMFQGEAAAAMAFYVSLFPEARIVSDYRYGPGEQGAEGQVKTGSIAVGGQTIRFLDSPRKHNFSFTPSSSLYVDCTSEEDFHRIADALAEGGVTLMPKGVYGFSRHFAWVNDRFGVSWQINLP